MTGYNVSILLIIRIQSAACFNHNSVNKKLHTVSVPCSQILGVGVFLSLSASRECHKYLEKINKNANSFYCSFVTLFIFKYRLLKKKNGDELYQWLTFLKNEFCFKM